jgi:hypothetical protein
MSFTPFLLAARHSIEAKAVGLAKKGDKYHLQCLDPGPPLTPGGTVVFEMEKETGVTDDSPE